MSSRILIVGDPHAHPLYDNDRFEWLGKYATSVQPDHIVVMGDWADVPSLNQHGKTIDKEGLRLKDDKAALHDSLRRFEAALTKFNAQQRAIHKAMYRPKKHYVLGNHEARIGNYEAEHPELLGLLDEDWLGPFHDAGWLIYPFKDTLTLEGYEISHFFPSGTMGRPIGGKSGSTLAAKLVADRHTSSIVGHDHRFGIASLPVGRRRIWGINAGCFAHPLYNEPWCRQTEPMWDRGVLLLDGAQDGDHSRYTWTSQVELQRRYGAKEE